MMWERVYDVRDRIGIDDRLVVSGIRVIVR